ncbi:Uncharacterised protein [Starkeya nomas]|uniref:Uncharacterized protein n=1 Tax=Starkeya nomas TaxID=2666134 RepID=A0A5S9PF27_9HYPH|nr:Uncharacterised protein [Starkeya nomas]
MNEISDGSVRVTALRLLEEDPLLAASRRDWPEGAGALGWRWETFVDEELINPFCGSPTDQELDACTRCLLRFGRLSFLSSDAEPFRSAGHQLLETGSRPDLLGRMRKMLLKERLWLVSSIATFLQRTPCERHAMRLVQHAWRFTAPLVAALCVFAALAEAQDRQLTRSDGSVLDWSIERPSGDAEVPIMIFMQGSGCAPVSASASAGIALARAVFDGFAAVTLEKYGYRPPATRRPALKPSIATAPIANAPKTICLSWKNSTTLRGGMAGCSYLAVLKGQRWRHALSPPILSMLRS